MNQNKTVIQCPECGSKKTKYIDDDVFECLNCQTSFLVETNQTTVKHKHTYTNSSSTTSFNSPVIKPKTALIFVGLALGFLALFMFPLLFKSSNKVAPSFTTEEKVKAGGYTFNVFSSVPFTDNSGSLKVFILGQPDAENYENKKYENTVFWAIYDPLKNSYDQISQLKDERTSSVASHGGECFRFDDGNIYFVFATTKLYKYDVSTKNIEFLNNEIAANVKELKSGITEIRRASHKFSAFTIQSNTNKAVTYYPVSKFSTNKNFDVTNKKQSYPNDQPKTFFFQSDSAPSYLVRFTAMYSVGYPFSFDPSINVKFDEDENFVEGHFSDYWTTASRLLDMKVLNTEDKLYDMTILDYRDGIVAMGVRTSNISNDRFILQWVDYDGKLLWSTPTEITGLYDLSGALNKDKGILFSPCCDDYVYYDNKGKLIKSFKLDEIPFNLD